jgi:hypothetical protein
MKRTNQYVRLLLLAGLLIVPVATPRASLFAGTKPAAAPAADKHPHRYYDKSHKDYHEWTEAEDRAYRHYLEERREQYRDFAKLERKQQREYWKWRHEHPEEVR